MLISKYFLIPSLHFSILRENCRRKQEREDTKPNKKDNKDTLEVVVV